MIRRARLEAGLSLAGLAVRMGVSWDTVRRAEIDRDPRCSTLARCARALPFVSPAALLGVDGQATPLASDAAWLLHRDILGHVVTRLVHEVVVLDGDARRVRQEWRGVLGHGTDLGDPPQRTNILRAVVPAPMAALRELVARPEDARGGVRRFEAGGATHELRFHRPLASRGFTHRRVLVHSRQPADPALRDATLAARGVETTGIDIDSSIDVLELRVVTSGIEPPAFRLFAAFESAPSGDPFLVARDLHAGTVVAAWDPRSRALSVTVPRPQPHVRYGLAWGRPGCAAGFEPATARVASGGRPDAGRAIRGARIDAGLSARDLAGEARISPATLIALEAGSDPRRDTLRRVLRALPGLRASALLASDEPGREPLESNEAWLYQRELAGVVAREARRVVEVGPKGDATETIALDGLRHLRSSGADIVLRDAIARTQAGRVGPVLLDGDAPGASSLRVRWQRVPGEQDEYFLVIPAAVAASGANVTRRERKTAAYKVARDQVGRSIGPAFECPVPAERLELVVRLPRRLVLAEVRAQARAAVQVTNPLWPDLSERLHPKGFDFAWDAARAVARLVVERPLMGLRYSITWRFA